MTRWWLTVLPTAAIALALLAGCNRAAEQPETPAVTPAPTEAGLDEDRAREIIAQVIGLEPVDIMVVSRGLDAGVAEVGARVPADERLLPLAGGAGDEELTERLTVRWDLDAERPEDILWEDRLQFSEQEPVTEQEAEATAGELKDRWFPEVPATMAMAPARKLHRPAWVIAWRGETDDGTLTGDEVIVQVSSVTGLPIAYNERVAVQRPSPDEVTVARDQAITAARQALKDAGWRGADTAQLSAVLTLSSAAQPEGGPAWLVRATSGEDRRQVAVDAISGEVIDAGEVGAVVGGA